MKIVDINGVIGYTLGKVQPAFTQEDLLREMDRAGVDTSVVFYTRSVMQIRDGNADMKAIADRSNGRIQACFMVHPYLDDIQMPKDLKGYLRKARPAAVTIDPKRHKYPFVSRYCGEMLRQLEQLRIPLFVRVGQVPGYEEKILMIADEYPNLPIVVVEQGYTVSMFLRTALMTTKNVYLNLGFIENASELNQLVREFGADRFLMGSTAGSLAGGALGLIYLGEFTQEEKEKMLGGNWQRLQEGIQWES